MLYTNSAISKRKNRKRKLKNFLSIVINILLIPILIYNLSLIVQAILNPKKTPSFLGIKTYVIISGSMQPELNIGDIVIVEEVDKEELKKEDIISFRKGQSVVTHRISEIINENENITFKTKGDNNNTEDSGTINFEMIEGKVIKIVPNIGKISLALQNKLVIILITIIGYIYLLISGTNKKKKNKRYIKRLNHENEKN